MKAENSFNEIIKEYHKDLREISYVINLFDYINQARHSENVDFLIYRLVETFLNMCRRIDTEPKTGDTSSIIISMAEHHILYSLTLYLYYEAPPDEQNMNMLVVLFDAGRTNDDKSDLDRLYDMLEKKDPSHISLFEYEKFRTLTQSRANMNDVFKSLLRNTKPIFSNKVNFADFIKTRIIKNNEAYIYKLLAISTVDNFKPNSLARGSEQYKKCRELFEKFFKNIINDNKMENYTTFKDIMLSSEIMEHEKLILDKTNESEEILVKFEGILRKIKEFYCEFK